MSVTVDDELLPADEMGLQTVGQVLAHLQKENRLVVQVLIDGHEPDLALAWKARFAGPLCTGIRFSLKPSNRAKRPWNFSGKSNRSFTKPIGLNPKRSICWGKARTSRRWRNSPAASARGSMPSNP